MDENNGTTVVAESSPAAEAPVTVEVPRDSAAYTHWRMTGEMPAAKAATEKPKASASKESSEAPGTENAGAGNNAPASEAGSTQEKKPRSTAETRLNELLADLKRAGMSPAELKTYKREAQGTQTDQPKPEHTAKPAETKADPDAPVRPKADGFKTWEEFEAAKDEYVEKLADYKAQKAVSNFQAQQQQQAAQQTMQAKFAEAKQRYGDEAETTIVSAAQSLAGDAQIPAAVKAMFEQSPVMTDLLYVMGSKPAEFEAFVELARTNPAAAIRKMVLTESLVTAELGKATKAAATESTSQADRDDTGKFTPAKKVTSAPPPPREAAGRSAPPADEAERAALTGDFRTFRDAENRKDVAAKRGR